MRYKLCQPFKVLDQLLAFFQKCKHFQQKRFLSQIIACILLQNHFSVAVMFRVNYSSACCFVNTTNTIYYNNNIVQNGLKLKIMSVRHINFTNWMLTSFGWYTRPVEHLEIHCPPSHQWRVPRQWAASSHTDRSPEHSSSHSTNRSIMTVSFLSVSWPYGFHSLFWKLLRTELSYFLIGLGEDINPIEF